MRERTVRYKGKDLTIYFTPSRCTHVAECLRGAPEVFDSTRKPWIITDAEPADHVAKVIETCPTGALHYKWREKEDAEKPPKENTIDVVADGPLYFHGDLEVKNPKGETVIRDTRLAFCRCGLTEHNPLCDDSHELEFSDEGQVSTERLPKPSDSPAGMPVHIKVMKNGPLLIDGPVTIKDARGNEIVRTEKTALCRCGASKRKPFCDGRHSGIRFREPGELIDNLRGK